MVPEAEEWASAAEAAWTCAEDTETIAEGRIETDSAVDPETIKAFRAATVRPGAAAS